MYSNPTIIWIARGAFTAFKFCAKEGSPATVQIHGETSDQPTVATLLIQNCCKHRLGIKSWYFQGIIPEGKLLYSPRNFKMIKNPTQQRSA